MKKTLAVFDHLLNGMEILSGLVMVLMTLMICVSVIFRYVLNAPIAWTVEVAAFAMLYICILGAPKLMQLEGHVTIDLVTERLSVYARNLLNYISSLLGIFLCCVIVYYGIIVNANLIIKNTSVVEAIGIPQYAIVIMIPIGFFLLLLQYIRRTFGLYRKWRHPGTPESTGAQRH